MTQYKVSTAYAIEVERVFERISGTEKEGAYWKEGEKVTINPSSIAWATAYDGPITEIGFIGSNTTMRIRVPYDTLKGYVGSPAA